MITVDFDKLTIQPGYRILDIGCGPGRHACEAFRFKDVVVVGADMNEDDLREAMERLTYHEMIGEDGGGVWAISVADITRLPFKDNSYDLVICSEVMEHIPDEDAAISELIRVLKPGRNLVVSVPRYFPEWVCWALSDEYNSSSGGHIRIYKKGRIIDMLEAAGTRKWADHYAHSLHTPYWWLKCLVGPDREDSILVNLYHRFLIWDMMEHPWITRFMDKMLNPVMGKSMTLYFKKHGYLTELTADTGKEND